MTDEIGTLDQAIAFARQYRLRWVELRAYRPFKPEDVRTMKAKLDDAGLGVSFFNSALLKFTIPGTTPVAKEDFYEMLYAREGLTPEKLWAQREETLKMSIDSALAFGARRIRAFSFWRVADPASVRTLIVDAMGAMAAAAKKAGVEICLENEFATNTGTSAETVAVLKQVPGLMLNWDPQNSVALGEAVFPDGYRLLPKARLANVQIKAEGLIGFPDGKGKPVDWPGIFAALAADGYSGCFGLETHTLNGPEINVPASHECMKKMLALCGEPA
jgi:sugar phosphate isomerase/epimerase